MGMELHLCCSKEQNSTSSNQVFYERIITAYLDACDGDREFNSHLLGNAVPPILSNWLSDLGCGL